MTMAYFKVFYEANQETSKQIEAKQQKKQCNAAKAKSKDKMNA